MLKEINLNKSKIIYSNVLYIFDFYCQKCSFHYNLEQELRCSYKKADRQDLLV